MFYLKCENLHINFFHQKLQKENNKKKTHGFETKFVFLAFPVFCKVFWDYTTAW